MRLPITPSPREHLGRVRHALAGALRRHDEYLISVGVIALLVLVIVFAHSGGTMVFDNRYSFYVEPRAGLAQSVSLWDPSVDMGGTAPSYTPGVYLIGVVLDLLSPEPWVTQRLFHFVILVTAAAGAIAVGHTFLPERARRAGSLAAGLLYALGPFASTFLIPSWLYLNYALAPWLLLTVVAGIQAVRPLRWAAMLAALIFVSGWLNPPGLVFAALTVLPCIWYFTSVDRRADARSVLRFSAITGGLVLLVLLPGFIRVLGGGGEVLGQNLATTESVEAVSSNSSWSETWRGLGFWVSYYSFGGVLFAHTQLFFTSLAPLLVTFVPPILAFGSIWRSRWRPRILFGAMMVLSAVAMVGAFPLDRPSPYGNLLVEVFGWADFAFAFRNSYKAGAGLILGMSILFGLGVAALVRRGALWPIAGRVAGGAVVVVAFAGLLWPFLGGSVYDRPRGIESIPDYWIEATEWLNDAPGETRVMVAPGTPQGLYRWGSPGDEIEGFLLERPFVMERSLSISPPESANLIKQLNAELASGSYRAGGVAAVSRRVGIEYLLIRNDLRWERLGLARPDVLSDVRTDPDLELVATFGEPGENVLAADDTTPEASREDQLPPIEIYRVDGVEDPVSVSPVAPPVLVSGDGAAWPGLARAGYLRSPGPVRYTGSSTTDSLESDLSAGASVVLTDTNRRQQAAFGAVESETLAADDDRRAVANLFDNPRSQTTATYGAAARINDVTTGEVNPQSRANRPAAAFDRDLSTAWLAGNRFGVAGQALLVDFRRPQSIDSITLTPFRDPAGRGPSRARLDFSDGYSQEVLLEDGATQLSIPEVESTWVRIEITSINGLGSGPVGFSEVRIGDLDLRERIRLPSDLLDAARRGGFLEAVEAAPFAVQLRRFQAAGDAPEPAMLREFETVGSRALALRGGLRLAPGVSAESLRDLFATAFRPAWPSSEMPAEALLAIDGDGTTVWRSGEYRLDFVSDPPLRTVEIDLVSPVDRGPLDDIRVEVEGQGLRTVRVDSSTCRSVGEARYCTARLVLPGEPTSQIVIRDVGPGSSIPLEIGEIRLDGQPNASFADVASSECIDLGLRLDGRSIALRLNGTLSDTLGGRAIRFQGCAPIDLDAGLHLFTSGVEYQVDDVLLTSDGPPAAPAPSPPMSIEVIERGDTSLRVRLEGQGEVLLRSGIAFTQGWQATSDDAEIGSARPADTQSAWVVDVEDSAEVEISLPSQERYAVSVVVSWLAVVFCVVVGIWGRAWVATQPRPKRDRGRWPGNAALVGGAFLFGGLTGGIVAGAALVVVLQRRVTPKTHALVALGMLGLAVIFTVPPLGPSLAPLHFGWAEAREAAHAAGRMAAVVLVAALVLLGRSERSGSDA